MPISESEDEFDWSSISLASKEESIPIISFMLGTRKASELLTLSNYMGEYKSSKVCHSLTFYLLKGLDSAFLQHFYCVVLSKEIR